MKEAHEIVLFYYTMICSKYAFVSTLDSLLPSLCLQNYTNKVAELRKEEIHTILRCQTIFLQWVILNKYNV